MARIFHPLTERLENDEQDVSVPALLSFLRLQGFPPTSESPEP